MNVKNLKKKMNISKPEKNIKKNNYLIILQKVLMLLINIVQDAAYRIL